MSLGSKTEIAASNFEADTQSLQVNSKIRLLRAAENARLGLTALALVAGIVILGVSADSVAVYNSTRVPDDFLLPLWPSGLDIRPTVALIVGAAVVVVANIVSLTVSNIATIRNNARAHTSLTFAGPTVALIAAVISVAFFYAVNGSSTAESFQSWTCRWKSVTMTTQPKFSTLCKEHQTGVALAVMLVPVEAIILGVAAYQTVQGKQFSRATRGL